MRTVTAREFRNSMNIVVDTAQQTGESIMVIKNSKPWIVVTPVIPEVEEGLQQLEAQKNNPSAKVFNSAEELFTSLGI